MTSERRARDGSRVGQRTANGRARLTPSDVGNILSLYAVGERASTIARRFGVDRSRVYQLTRGIIAARNPDGGHDHRWISEGGLIGCDLCGEERPA